MMINSSPHDANSARERLIEILGIEPEIVVEYDYIKYPTLDEAVDHFSDDEVLRFVKKRFTKSEILELVA